MGNPVMTPPPPQAPYPPRPPRSIAGAIVLILLGALFLMGTMGILNWHGLSVLFAKYWPALLILWGIIKLIEHEQSKRAGLPSRGIGVGGVFLVIFIIFAGLIATGVSRVDWGNVKDHLQIDDNDFDQIFGGNSYDYSGNVTEEVPAGAKTLQINDEHGAVTINVADDKKVRVEWRKKVHAENQHDADNYNTRTPVTLTPAGKDLVLTATTQAAGSKVVNTDIDVYVPRDTELIITARHGDLSINGMAAGAQVVHQNGEVNIGDMTGSVALTLDRSSARVHHVKGDITVQGRANEIDVEDIDGAVHLSGEFQESVRLVRVSKTVAFNTSRTDMEFARLDGRLDLDSGDLRADSLLGPMKLTTRSKDIALEGLSGDLRLDTENGTVDISLQKPGNIQIDNRKGDVQVTVPPKTALKVEARTRQGDIQSDFSEIKVETSNNQASASGSIGTNGPRLAINCDKGDIEIRKGTMMTTPATPAVAAAPATPAEPPSPAPAPGPGKLPKNLPAPKAKPVESEN